MELVFTSESSLFAWLIRYFTKRSWVGSARVSHVALRYDDDFLLESNKEGFLPKWWPLYLKNKKIYKKFKINGVSKEKLNKIVKDCANELMGKNYDFLAILGFVLSVAWFWVTGHKPKSFLGLHNAYICSESMYYIFKKVEEVTGNKYFRDYDIEMIFPEELLIDAETKKKLFKEDSC